MQEILQKYNGMFALRETKQMPGMLDWFGWCPWDAFYQDVNPQGIRDWFGGTPTRFLIIDDGWQDTANEFQKEGEPFREGSQFGARLMSIRENEKFRKAANDDSSSKPRSLKGSASDIKGTFGLKYASLFPSFLLWIIRLLGLAALYARVGEKCN